MSRKRIIASKQVMTYVPDDIVRDILLRLPCVKDFFRCNLVSQQFLSVINDPEFTAQYFSQYPYRIEGFELFFFGTGGSVHRLYCEKGKESGTDILHPNFGTQQRWTNLRQPSSSALDLVLFKHISKNEVYVLNPTRKQWLRIPGPKSSPSTSGFPGIVNDPENYGHYVAVIMDVKYTDGIVNHPPYLGYFHRFCSRTRVWSSTKFWATHDISQIQNPISSQGVLYFPVTYGEKLEPGVFIYFPLKSNRFRLVGRPTNTRHDEWTASSTKDLFFGVVSGRLRASQLLKRGRVLRLKTWELIYDVSDFESDRSWVTVHNVRLTSGNDDKTTMSVAAFHPYNGDVIFMLRDGINICRYNIRHRDEYEIVGQLPKDHLPDGVKALTLVHKTVPTPVGPRFS